MAGPQPDGENLDGFTIELGTRISCRICQRVIFDEEATATTADGIGGFFNVEPGNHFINVEKEGVLCTSSPWSWNTKFGM